MTQHNVQRVGLFGGAFDPPHRIHRVLAETAISQLALDVLHIVPTGTAWHKQRTLSPAVHRLAMCEAAFSGLPGVRIDDCELRRTGPSYSLQTLQELQQIYPGAQLFLIIGADQARALPTWHQIEAIRETAIICVAQRAESLLEGQETALHPLSEAVSHAPVLQASPPEQIIPVDPVAGQIYLQIPASRISATEVRQLAGAGRSIAHLVLEPVARYIEHHHLYQTDR